jgi:L-asparaginase II
MVEVLRGGVVETRHRLHAAICTADGALVASVGDPDLVTFMRSAAKPFQALPAVEGGVLERFDLNDRHLAIGCSSHSGSPLHAGVVADLLARAGIPLSALRPHGPHPPIDVEAARQLERSGREPASLEHNCSGNHALMLAHARARDEPLDGYLDPEGPRQTAASEAVVSALGCEARLGVDRCGMTAYAAPLTAMATAYARLALGTLDSGWHDAAERGAAAMRAHPELVAGRGRLDTLAMALPGVVAKGGARGVVCVGSSVTGLGGALKVEDGDGDVASRAGTLLVEAITRRRPIAALAELREAPLVDGAGRSVGEYRVHLTLYA